MVQQIVRIGTRASKLALAQSGMMQRRVAAALGVPVVTIFGPTDPARNGPFGKRNVVLRSPTSQTSYAHRSAVDPGMLAITAEEVVAAARRLLREHD